jgi:hypothetical protein
MFTASVYYSISTTSAVQAETTHSMPKLSVAAFSSDKALLKSNQSTKISRTQKATFTQKLQSQVSTEFDFKVSKIDILQAVELY